MNRKGFVNLIVIIGIIIFIGVAGYFAVHRWAPSFAPVPSFIPVSAPTPVLTPAPMPKPSPAPTPTSTPTSPSGRSWTPYLKDGTCPLGYVNYGIPLQCVTPDYLGYCKTHPCPICLAGTTLIETPSGAVSVKDLRVGMLIWTADKSGHHMVGVIERTSRVPVPPTHQMVDLILKDGRELFASLGHPTIDGRTVGDLVPGDLYDGASILSVRRVPYDENATYDILPSGDTGFYWANGIIIGSTLR